MFYIFYKLFTGLSRGYAHFTHGRVYSWCSKLSGYFFYDFFYGAFSTFGRSRMLVHFLVILCGFFRISFSL
ncbi:hypothetical protein DCC81_02655 [Chitinophaga parva]|uniref:Uncharacterized protein n=1 Tax=Chitinophaga parva TaxID=2169414 RepID=A0A2T7BL43_9BACT|nr:hypothetical protein DCC81_02655 [Chitinophaga parva]